MGLRGRSSWLKTRSSVVTAKAMARARRTSSPTWFSLDRLTQLVRDHVTASGVGKQGACHLFRHTLATLMLEGGADIRYEAPQVLCRSYAGCGSRVRVA